MPAPTPSDGSSLASLDEEKQDRSQDSNAGFQSVVNDEFDAVNLPYRTLSRQARMGEYLTETPSGLQPVRTATRHGPERDYELVTFVEGDKENPKNWSKAYFPP